MYWLLHIQYLTVLVATVAKYFTRWSARFFVPLFIFVLIIVLLDFCSQHKASSFTVAKMDSVNTLLKNIRSRVDHIPALSKAEVRFKCYAYF